MKNDEKLDDLLRRSLQAEKTGPVPSAQIQRETIEKMRERYTMLSKKNTQIIVLDSVGRSIGGSGASRGFSSLAAAEPCADCP